jgi:hypothetical protein
MQVVLKWGNVNEHWKVPSAYIKKQGGKKFVFSPILQLLLSQGRGQTRGDVLKCQLGARRTLYTLHSKGDILQTELTVYKLGNSNVQEVTYISKLYETVTTASPLKLLHILDK